MKLCISNFVYKPLYHGSKTVPFLFIYYLFWINFNHWLLIYDWLIDWIRKHTAEETGIKAISPSTLLPYYLATIDYSAVTAMQQIYSHQIGVKSFLQRDVYTHISSCVYVLGRCPPSAHCMLWVMLRHSSMDVSFMCLFNAVPNI